MRSAMFSTLRFGIRALRRDWNSGELRLLILALLIAVAAVTSVGFLADRVWRALERDSAQMLGGDISVRGDQAFAAEFFAQAHARQLLTAETWQFPSMVGKGENIQLVSLKAVSDGYPLRGELRLADQPGKPAYAASRPPAKGTVYVDARVLTLLNVSVGDEVLVGDASLKIAQLIAYEPDRSMQFVNVAPRLMMHISDLDETGLVAPGSRITYNLLVAGDAQDVQGYKSWLARNMTRGQQLSTVETNRPEVQRTLVRAKQFLVLVALLTVMIAAVAVALAARRFNLRHQDGIAILRCLGASKSQLTGMLWVEFLSLGLIASVLGCLLGYVVHLGLVTVVSSWLGTDMPAMALQPAWQGLATGLLLLIGFALPPLAALPRVAPARVLRRESTPDTRRWLSYVLAASSFFLLIVWISQDLRLSVILAAGFLLALMTFAALAYALVAVLSLFRYRVAGHPSLRFALAGMARRRALTVTQLCALSMGLMILLLLAITRTDLLEGWQATLPPDAPNTFLINIQGDQQEPLTNALQAAGVASVRMAPMVRGRLLAINQQPVDANQYEDARAKRMVDREFNLSYDDALPSSNEVVEGRWLDADKNEVSIETGLAETLGIKVSDTVTFDVAGREVQVTVTSLRKVDWDSFQANFFAVMSPSALAGSPATFITSLHIPATDPGLAQRLLREFPNLTVFDIGSILGQIQTVLNRVIQAVQLLFLFTVLAGVLVLGAALFSTRDERMHEVAVLRALGASGRQLAAAMRIELLLLGAVAGLLAAFGAVAISWLLAREVFDFPLSLSLWPWLVGAGAGMLASVAGGSIALAGVLKTPPLVTLREAV